MTVRRGGITSREAAAIIEYHHPRTAALLRKRTTANAELIARAAP